MEQAPGLTMTSNSTTRTPKPEGEAATLPKAVAPTDPPTSDPPTSSNQPTTAPSDATDNTSSSSTGEASSPLQNTAQRAFQHGLSRENLEQEVNQVMGTFNSWWGGLKKQSATAYTSIKAEVDKTVVQAQQDLEYLRTAKIEVGLKDNNAPKPDKDDATGDDVKGKGKAKEEAPSPTATRSSEDMTPGTTFLNRLTSSTSQLQQTLQTTFQTTLASASSNPAISNPAQLRAQLAENLRLSSAKENLQLSMKQAEKLAEDYLKKSDQWIKGAEKWMEDAVKVLPPDDDEEARYVATGWDGGDFYSFSTSTSAKEKVKKGDVLFEAGGKSSLPSLPGAALAGSRKEALLRRLREDKELLMVDPADEGESDERKAEFKEWVEKEWPELSKQGKEKEEAHIGAIRMELVPEALTDEQFWQRYLFHKSMIEAEDEKRKKVLEASQQTQQEDFNWDDEDESSVTSPTTATAEANPRASTTTLRPPAPESEDTPKDKADTPKPPADPKVPKAPAPAGPAAPGASTSTSPRDSEESYDLVSDQGGRAAAKPAPPSQDDDDSDWE